MFNFWDLLLILLLTHKIVVQLYNFLKLINVEDLLNLFKFLFSIFMGIQIDLKNITMIDKILKTLFGSFLVNLFFLWNLIIQTNRQKLSILIILIIPIRISLLLSNFLSDELILYATVLFQNFLNIDELLLDRVLFRFVHFLCIKLFNLFWKWNTFKILFLNIL